MLENNPEKKLVGNIWNGSVRVLETVEAGDGYMELYYFFCFCINLKLSKIKYK